MAFPWNTDSADSGPHINCNGWYICCTFSSKQDGSASLGMRHGWTDGQLAWSVQGFTYRTSIRGLPKNWRRRPGRPRHTWLRTLEADLQPPNRSLNSAWRHAQDRGRWKQLVETATLQSGARPRWWWYFFMHITSVVLFSLYHCYFAMLF